jgi:nudix-type nucleoside diphosphatase (YffH/AdpP family)
MKAKILKKNILSNLWGEYAQYIIEYTRLSGEKQIQKREIQHNGNGAAVLLYNLQLRELILIKQFRLATFLNKNESGIIIEVCAGLVENDDPVYTIKKEIKEEIGIDINDVKYLYKGYATPGAKTELIYFFIAEYDPEVEVKKAGGKEDEQEDIEVIRIKFDHAYEMIEKEEIFDLKTISLLQYAKIYLFNT